jgi:hypothetical protein
VALSGRGRRARLDPRSALSGSALPYVGIAPAFEAAAGRRYRAGVRPPRRGRGRRRRSARARARESGGRLRARARVRVRLVTSAAVPPSGAAFSKPRQRAPPPYWRQAARCQRERRRRARAAPTKLRARALPGRSQHAHALKAALRAVPKTSDFMNINVQKAYTIGTSPQSRAETPAWAAAKSHARARESGGRAVTARPLRWAATARRRFRPRGGDTERGEDGAAFSKPRRARSHRTAPGRAAATRAEAAKGASGAGEARCACTGVWRTRRDRPAARTRPRRAYSALTPARH